jgi:hypothetical protein
MSMSRQPEVDRLPAGSHRPISIDPPAGWDDDAGSRLFPPADRIGPTGGPDRTTPWLPAHGGDKMKI